MTDLTLALVNACHTLADMTGASVEAVAIGLAVGITGTLASLLANW